MAVREEVEELKTQISELLQDNEQLRKENALLKEGTSGSSQLLQHRTSTQVIPEFPSLVCLHADLNSLYFGSEEQ